METAHLTLWSSSPISPGCPASNTENGSMSAIIIMERVGFTRAQIQGSIMAKSPAPWLSHTGITVSFSLACSHAESQSSKNKLIDDII